MPCAYETMQCLIRLRVPPKNIEVRGRRVACFFFSQQDSAALCVAVPCGPDAPQTDP